MLAAAAARADELAAPGLSPRPRRKVAVLVLHGHAHRPLPHARAGARGRPHHPQRRRAGDRRRDPLAQRLPAPARHRGDRRRHARGLRPARRVRGRVRRSSSPPTACCRRGAWARSTTSRHAARQPRPAALEPRAAARDHVRGFVFDPEPGRCARSTGSSELAADAQPNASLGPSRPRLIRLSAWPRTPTIRPPATAMSSPSPLEWRIDAVGTQRSTSSSATPSARNVSTRAGHSAPHAVRCPSSPGIGDAVGHGDCALPGTGPPDAARTVGRLTGSGRARRSARPWR